MNAAFFGLAGLAALNPKLLVIDLILAENQRPRLMFVCFLLGGMGMAVTVGLLAANHVHVSRGPHPAAAKPPPKLEIWVERVLHEPHYALAVLIGAAVGTPGVSYLLALN